MNKSYILIIILGIGLSISIYKLIDMGKTIKQTKASNVQAIIIDYLWLTLV